MALKCQELQLFGWKLSYFSGKVRAYLRYKARVHGFSFTEVTASPNVLPGGTLIRKAELNLWLLGA